MPPNGKLQRVLCLVCGNYSSVKSGVLGFISFASKIVAILAGRTRMLITRGHFSLFSFIELVDRISQQRISVFQSVL